MSNIDPLKFPHRLIVRTDTSQGERAEEVCLVMTAKKIHCQQSYSCFNCKKFTERDQSNNSNEFERDCRKTFWQRCDRTIYYANQLKNAVVLGKFQLWDHLFDKVEAVPRLPVDFVPEYQPPAERYYEANPIIAWVKNGWIANEDIRTFCNFERFRVDFQSADEGDNREHTASKEITTIADAIDSTPTPKNANTVEASTPQLSTPIEIKETANKALSFVNDESSESDGGGIQLPGETSDKSKQQIKANKKQDKIDADVRNFSSRPDESFVTIEVIAKLLNKSLSTVERLVKDGLLVKHNTSTRGIGFNVGESRSYMQGLAKDKS